MTGYKRAICSFRYEGQAFTVALSSHHDSDFGWLSRPFAACIIQPHHVHLHNGIMCPHMVHFYPLAAGMASTVEAQYQDSLFSQGLPNKSGMKTSFQTCGKNCSQPEQHY